LPSEGELEEEREGNEIHCQVRRKWGKLRAELKAVRASVLSGGENKEVTTLGYTITSAFAGESDIRRVRTPRQLIGGSQVGVLAGVLAGVLGVLVRVLAQVC
jgi:hypothetical protein